MSVNVTINTSLGTLKAELYEDKAPITVKNFLAYVDEGFYNGTIFHRVIPGFMIQGGDPEGTGYGGSENEIKGEFSVNKVENNISHLRGVISMARAHDYNSASSQFFICHADAKFLDSQYAAFGAVVEGIETVDKISAVRTDRNDRPLSEQKIKRVYFVAEQ